MKKFSNVIAIDGPSGSGKSTIAKLVAKKLDLVYIDTGAMFRALGLYFESLNFEIENPDQAELKKIEASLEKLDFQYAPTPIILVQLNGVDLTQKIRDHHVSKLASQVSKLKVVRKYLKELQRDIAGKKHCVMEGRDIGTVVFPDAYCKIFLTASNEVRAQRRHLELKARGDNTSLETILADIIKRDESDQSRSLAPLKKADDAFELDTSVLSIEEVAEKIIFISVQRMRAINK